MNLILASNSPRRRELLADLGLDFEVRVMQGIDESYPPELPTAEIAAYISKKKAAAYIERLTDDELVITADTIVVLDDEVMGKPADDDEARQMLRRLSGRRHQVITGVTVATTSRSTTFDVVSTVEFAPLSDTEIDYYVTRYRPLDKAGAYGIQEWIGCMGVKNIEGSFYNVMGLPLHRLYNVLKGYGVAPCR